MGGGKQVSEEEAADANQRNRAISSSAISRAMSDANTGMYITVNSTSLLVRYNFVIGSDIRVNFMQNTIFFTIFPTVSIPKP